MHDTPDGPPVLIRTSLVDYSPADIQAATPALIFRGDNLTTIFDLDRATHGTTRQVPIGKMRESVGIVKATGKPKKGNEHYNRHYDRFVGPVVAALERGHGASVAALERRRHLARSQSSETAQREVVQGEFLRALEAKELEVAALRIHGNRMTKARYGRDRNLRCKESNAEQGARRAQMTENAKTKNRMGSIDTWSFEKSELYTRDFESIVGCTPGRYAALVDPKALLALRRGGDTEAYAAAREELRVLRARKVQLCMTVVLAGIAGHTMREPGAGWGVPALVERLSEATEPLEVNLTDVARRMGGPLVPGSTTIVRPNASQCIKDLLRKHAAGVLSVEMLRSPGERGVHTTRRADARVRVGNRLVRVPQAPTMKKVNAVFQEAWVKTGLVKLGRPIVRLDTAWAPNGDGELVVQQRDQSGRLIPKGEQLPAIVEQMRADDVLGSMPDFSSMPMEIVGEHLTRLHLPAEIKKGECEPSKRLRARQGLQNRRAARPRPKLLECTHCHCSLRCPRCMRWSSVCECEEAPDPAPGCRECARAGRAAPAEVRADLAVRGVTLETHAWLADEPRALAYLIGLEADDDAREDLVSIGEPACASREEGPQARERRLAIWQNRLLMWLWIDDSPIAKKTIMLHLWGWLFHPVKMRWSRGVGQMCQRCVRACEPVAIQGTQQEPKHCGVHVRVRVRGGVVGAHRYAARVDSRARRQPAYLPAGWQ